MSQNTILEIPNAKASIQTITRFVPGYYVIFTNQAIYFFNYGGSGLWDLMAFHFGLLGYFIAKKVTKKRQEAMEEKIRHLTTSLDDLIQQTPMSCKFMYSEIESCEAKGLLYRYHGLVNVQMKIQGKKVGLYVPKEVREQVLQIIGTHCPQVGRGN